MHNLKEIRKDYKTFNELLKKRLINVDLTKLKKLDEDNRELIQKKETLESKKKEISKSNDESLFNRSKEISVELAKIIKNQKELV